MKLLIYSQSFEVTQMTSIPKNKLLICNGERQNIALLKQAAQIIRISI